MYIYIYIQLYMEFQHNYGKLWVHRDIAPDKLSGNADENGGVIGKDNQNMGFDGYITSGKLFAKLWKIRCLIWFI